MQLGKGRPPGLGMRNATEPTHETNDIDGPRLLSHIGSALCRTAHATAPGYEEVYLSWGLLLRGDFSEPHASPSRSCFLAGLKTQCETYPGKLGNRELFLPPGGFMKVDTPM